MTERRYRGLLGFTAHSANVGDRLFLPVAGHTIVPHNLECDLAAAKSQDTTAGHQRAR
jgi:hypothetical protein